MDSSKQISSSRSTEKRRRYRSDGTLIWSKRAIAGPGVWVSCVRGKEKQTIGELNDLFQSLADQIWPDSNNSESGGASGSGGEDAEDIEGQVAKELVSLKQPRTERLFTNCQTNTPCVIFISCKPPVDPVKLVVTHIENVERTGVLQTRYTQRLIPVSGTCNANIQEIHALCRCILPPFFSKEPEKKYTYKIDLRVRNHTSMSRPTIIQEIASCVPEEHTVNLENPQIFVLVEVFKSVCGISIVKDYYRQQKFNIMEIANVRNRQDFFHAEGRIHGRENKV